MTVRSEAKARAHSVSSAGSSEFHEINEGEEEEYNEANLQAMIDENKQEAMQVQKELGEAESS